MAYAGSATFATSSREVRWAYRCAPRAAQHPAPVPGGQRPGHSRSAGRGGPRRPDGRDPGWRHRADRDARRGDRAPRSRYVADLFGVNLLRGTADGTVLRLHDGGQLVVAHPGAGPVLAAVAPAGVLVFRQRPEGKENTWPGQISAVDELKLDDGGELWASVDPSAVSVYPP